MDVHVPATITDALRRLAIEVLTSQQDATCQADDPGLLTRATTLDRILVTQDEDFLRIAPEWRASMCLFRGLVYAHQLPLPEEEREQRFQTEMACSLVAKGWLSFG